MKLGPKIGGSPAVNFGFAKTGLAGLAKEQTTKTYYKILNVDGLPFKNLHGIKSGDVFEFLWDAPDLGQVILRRKLGCTVHMDYAHVEKLEGV
jgi:hypothetical protein